MPTFISCPQYTHFDNEKIRLIPCSSPLEDKMTEKAALGKDTGNPDTLPAPGGQAVFGLGPTRANMSPTFSGLEATNP